MNILSRVKIKGKMYKSSINVVNDTFNEKHIYIYKYIYLSAISSMYLITAREVNSEIYFPKD
jgi:hypothetical protein